MIFISLILKTLNGNKNNLKVKDLQKEVVILLAYYHIQLVDNQIEQLFMVDGVSLICVLICGFITSMTMNGLNLTLFMINQDGIMLHLCMLILLHGNTLFSEVQQESLKMVLIELQVLSQIHFTFSMLKVTIGQVNKSNSKLKKELQAINQYYLMKEIHVK